MTSGMQAIGLWSVAFFVPVVLLGKYFLMQLLTAIFIARLPELNYLDREEAGRQKRKRHMVSLKHELEDEIKKREAKQRQRAERAARALYGLASDGITSGAELRRSSEDIAAIAIDEHRQATRRIITVANQIVSWRSTRIPSLSFDNIILTLVLISMLSISLETYPAWPPEFSTALEAADYTLTTCFVTELLLQIIAQNRRWHKDGWNWLDAIIVVSALISYIPFDDGVAAAASANISAGGGASQMAATKGIRTLRVLRPLRTIKRFPHLKSTVTTLLRSLPATAGVLALTLFVWFIMSILGMQLLGGTLLECADGLTSVAFCDSTRPAAYNFDNVGNSLLTLLSLFKLDNWATQLWSAADQAETPTMVAATAAFFVAFVFFGSIIVTSLYLAMLVNEYQLAHDTFMTEEQTRWFEVQKLKARRDDIDSVRRAIAAAFAIGSGNMGSDTPGVAATSTADEKRRSRLVRTLIDGRKQGAHFRERWKRAKAERIIKPSLRPANKVDHPDVEKNASLILRDLSWRIVRGQPPHQLLETGICVVLTINWVLALARHHDQSHQLSAVQQTSTYFTTALFVIEIMLKVNAYELLGYLSSRSDATDCLFVVLSIVGIAYSALTDSNDGCSWPYPPSRACSLRGFLNYSPVLLSMYRMPRLLMNWRYFRRALLPARALLETLRFSLPAVFNIFLLMLLMVYIYAVVS